MANEKRLIDANELLDFVKGLKFYGGTKTRTQAGQEVLDIHLPHIVAKIPTVDAVEVVHGRWENADDGDGVVCSNCREDFCTIINETDRFNYCPNCGAKMDGGNEDG